MVLAGHDNHVSARAAFIHFRGGEDFALEESFSFSEFQFNWFCPPAEKINKSLIHVNVMWNILQLPHMVCEACWSHG